MIIYNVLFVRQPPVSKGEMEVWPVGIFKKGGRVRRALVNALLTVVALVVAELGGLPVVEPAADAVADAAR